MASALAEPIASPEPSSKQLEILILHAQGMTFGQIGEEIYLSERTVRWHLDNLKTRIGAKSLSNAVTICVGRGYICVDGRTCRPFVPEQPELLYAA